MSPLSTGRNSNSFTIVVMNRNNSIRATASPKQTLRPIPNGINALGLNTFPDPSRNLSGLNIFGWSNTLWSWKIESRLRMRLVFFGTEYPSKVTLSSSVQWGTERGTTDANLCTSIINASAYGRFVLSSRDGGRSFGMTLSIALCSRNWISGKFNKTRTVQRRVVETVSAPAPNRSPTTLNICSSVKSVLSFDCLAVLISRI